MTAKHLISKQVAVGLAYERLSEVALRIQAARANHCVVLGDDGQSFRGIVRLADIAARLSPGQRILADLVGSIRPLVIKSDESAAAVADLFRRHSLGEAVVLADSDKYVGLITAESVLAWILEQEGRRRTKNEAKTLAAPQQPTDGERSTRSARPGGPAILLVEDHEPSRRAMAKILSRRGFEVVESSSVEGALSLAEDHGFSLVISDIELGGGSGLDLIARLRALYGLKGIAVSGRATQTDYVRSQDAGFSFHLKKPINLRELDAAISAILER